MVSGQLIFLAPIIITDVIVVLFSATIHFGCENSERNNLNEFLAKFVQQTETFYIL